MQLAALGHAAYGFAAEGDEDRARVLAREVRATLQPVRDPVRQSLAWRAVAMASVGLGSYAAALEDEGLTLNPNDEILGFPAIIRDEALRRNCVLGGPFGRALIDSLGRLGLHWP